MVQSCIGGFLTPQVLRDQSLRARTSTSTRHTTCVASWQILKKKSCFWTHIFSVSMPRQKQKTWFYPKKRSLTRCFAMQISKSSATKLVQQIQGNTHDEMRPLGDSEGKKSGILCYHANHSTAEAAAHFSLLIGFFFRCSRSRSWPCRSEDLLLV